MSRERGPNASGFPTVVGRAGDREVFWLGDDNRADQLEAQYAAASRLLQLMLLNTYSIPFLSPDDVREAESLIASAPDAPDDEMCWTCKNAPAIGDTHLCREHNLVALALHL